MSPGLGSLGLALLYGVGIGLLHFWGLWCTVRCLPRVRQPGLVVLASAVGRLALSLGGFYLVMRTGWPQLLVCLAGFLGVRTCLLYGRRSRCTLLPGE